MTASERRALVRADGAGDFETADDDVVVEAPLAVRGPGGRTLLVTMRTPGDELDLVRGLLYAEGVLRDRADTEAVVLADPAGLSTDERGNVVDVELPAELLSERFAGRAAMPVSSACGACGAATIEAIAVRAQPVRSALTVSSAVIAQLPDRLRHEQAVFERTGGLHAAGAFDGSGRLLAVREDIGRHNAMDKLVGWALVSASLPMDEMVVCVSGRLGFEIAQKAAVAGIPLVVAVSAPSSLAIDVAERFQVTLCGFTRGGRFNIYTHPWRVS